VSPTSCRLVEGRRSPSTTTAYQGPTHQHGCTVRWLAERQRDAQQPTNHQRKWDNGGEQLASKARAVDADWLVKDKC